MPLSYEYPSSRGQAWDPRSLQEALRGHHPGGTGPAHGETRGDGSHPGDGAAATRSVSGLPAWEHDAFLRDTAPLIWLCGEEHDAYLDPATGLVLKLTQPGQTGKSTTWPEYLHRLALANELLDDAIYVAGRVRTAPRPRSRKSPVS